MISLLDNIWSLVRRREKARSTVVQNGYEGRSKKKVVSVHFGGFSKVVRHVIVPGAGLLAMIFYNRMGIPRRRRKLGVKTQCWTEIRFIFV